jgi:iron complex transport system ATP-binding protein
MLSVEDISVTLGQSRVLHDVSFAAKPGAVTAIVGPNGSGKTTLLRAITGDVAHTGSVTLNGEDTDTLHAWELATRRAVLPQASTLAFPFTVIEVVRIGLQQGTDGGAGHIATDALSRVGLAHYTDRFYQELSGGEQQRVQLARVLAQVWEPVQNGATRWLLLDEPVSSLDIGHQLEVMEILRDFTRKGGGVVAVMHDLNLTALYADAITMMSEGTVLATGTPAEVLTDSTLSRAYGCTIKANAIPAAGQPFVLPHGAAPLGHERYTS